MSELYDRLISKCSSTTFLKDISKLNQLADQINAFDHQPSEMTFVLIRIHSLRSGHSKGFFQLPYEGRSEVPSGDTSIENVIFSLDQFPEELLCLLQQFANTVENTKGETKIKPQRSPRQSPRASVNSPISSFMKKTIKPTPEIVLQNIDCAALDKTYSMNEILKYGEKSFFADFSNDPSTSIDAIGLVDDTRQQNRLIIEKDAVGQDDDLEVRLSLPNKKSLPHCFYCTLSIPHDWMPIPVYDGIFCSFHCARSYSLEFCKSYSDITSIYRKMLKQEPPIVTSSPDRRLLQKFGGSLSEEEYRKMFNSYYPVQSIQQTMIDPICTNGEDTSDGYSSYSSHARGNVASSIHYKAASSCLMNEPEKCIRIYKAN